MGTSARGGNGKCGRQGPAPRREQAGAEARQGARMRAPARGSRTAWPSSPPTPTPTTGSRARGRRPPPRRRPRRPRSPRPDPRWAPRPPPRRTAPTPRRSCPRLRCPARPGIGSQSGGGEAASDGPSKSLLSKAQGEVEFTCCATRPSSREPLPAETLPIPLLDDAADGSTWPDVAAGSGGPKPRDRSSSSPMTTMLCLR